MSSIISPALSNPSSFDALLINQAVIDPSMKLPVLLDNHKVRCNNVIGDVTYKNKKFDFERHFECEVDDLESGKTRSIVPFRNDPDHKIERVNLDKFEGNIIVDKDGSVWFGRFHAGPGKLTDPIKPFACHWGEAYGRTLYCSTNPEEGWEYKYDLV